MRTIETATLEVAYEDAGPPGGSPVVLLHGFPYDIHAFNGVVPLLGEAGCRVIVPYLRGFGPTRFLSEDTPRSGQQAALGADLLGLLDALDIRSAVLAGYDWGGRAACIVAALWPDRVRGLVSCEGYNIQDIAASVAPADPEEELRNWYQYYFHGERGRAGLTEGRRAFCRLLWRLWSPGWAFGDMTFDQTAASFDNPDFVDVVLHSYRHRFSYAPGDPALDWIERRLAQQPAITVPTIVLHGDNDGVSPAAESEQDAVHFTGPYARELVAGAGHNLPQEAPVALTQAVLRLVD